MTCGWARSLADGAIARPVLLRIPCNESGQTLHTKSGYAGLAPLVFMRTLASVWAAPAAALPSHMSGKTPGGSWRPPPWNVPSHRPSVCREGGEPAAAEPSTARSEVAARAEVGRRGLAAAKGGCRCASLAGGARCCGESSGQVERSNGVMCAVVSVRTFALAEAIDALKLAAASRISASAAASAASCSLAAVARSEAPHAGPGRLFRRGAEAVVAQAADAAACVPSRDHTRVTARRGLAVAGRCCCSEKSCILAARSGSRGGGCQHEELICIKYRLAPTPSLSGLVRY